MTDLIPQGLRWDPDPAFVWALGCWPSLTRGERPGTALHVGCGTGRNAVYLSRQGISVVGFERSARALEKARLRIRSVELDRPPILLDGDLQKGLPTGSFDLVADIFVYDELVESSVRKAYRADLARAVAPGGALLLCVTSRGDERYAAGSLWEGFPGPVAVPDPALGGIRLLFALEDLEREMSDRFSLRMLWRREKFAPGSPVSRYLVTLWSPSPLAKTEARRVGAAPHEDRRG